jgi:hypothetical protein
VTDANARRLILSRRGEYRGARQVREATARDLFYLEAEGYPSEWVTATLRAQLTELARAIADYEETPALRRLLHRRRPPGTIGLDETLARYTAECDELTEPARRSIS